MNMGGPGDHPLTDMVVHGLHPFPKKIEKLLRQVLLLDPNFPDGRRPYVEQLQWERRFFDWERRKGVRAGCKELKRVLRDLQDAGGT